MKKIIVLFALQFIAFSAFCQTKDSKMNNDIQLKRVDNIVPDKQDRNNNFYDNEETYDLPFAGLEVAGEVKNPGKVDFSKLPKRSVIIKETLLNEDGTNSFVGAYRYDGYSLFDILNDRILKKSNAAEFKPIIDLYVEIENARGDKVAISWGEIYYPNFLHNIIVATSVMRIVPSKTKELWPLPSECKLVVATDLVTERNITAPTRITVRSYPKSFKVNREMSLLFSEDFKLYQGEREIETISTVPANLQNETLHTIFYGKGRGIHSTQPFTGVYVKDYLAGKVNSNRTNLQKGLVVMVGRDGYRSAYTFSEIMNRNDQAEILLVPCENEKDGGKFRIFPSCDFFSDRAVKALSEIHIDLIRNP
jgi:hypothetical protein